MKKLPQFMNLFRMWSRLYPWQQSGHFRIPDKAIHNLVLCKYTSSTLLLWNLYIYIQVLYMCVYECVWLQILHCGESLADAIKLFRHLRIGPKQLLLTINEHIITRSTITQLSNASTCVSEIYLDLFLTAAVWDD